MFKPILTNTIKEFKNKFVVFGYSYGIFLQKENDKCCISFQVLKKKDENTVTERVFCSLGIVDQSLIWSFPSSNGVLIFWSE